MSRAKALHSSTVFVMNPKSNVFLLWAKECMYRSKEQMNKYPRDSEHDYNVATNLFHKKLFLVTYDNYLRQVQYACYFFHIIRVDRSHSANLVVL